MNKKQLRLSFNQVIKTAEMVKCKDLMHKKEDFHDCDQVCPVEYEISRHIDNLRKHMKDNDI